MGAIESDRGLSSARAALAALSACLALAGCAAGSGSGAPDGGGDARPGGIPPLAMVHDPEPVPVSSWMEAFADPASVGEVQSALESGTFLLPADGATSYGIDWQSNAPGDKGELGTPYVGTVLYAATQVDLPEGMHLFARADNLTTTYSAGALQPGDVYASGKIRVPLRSQAGANVVAVRAYTPRGEPQAELFRTPDELVFNFADQTVPDLVPGDASEQWLGVAVLNTTDTVALDVAARVEENDYFQATSTNHPALAANAVTQVAFRLVPKAAWPAGMAPGTKIPVALRLESTSLSWSYRRETTLATAAPEKPWRRTFRSGIDDSAQYYAVLRPSAFDPAKDYALVLSLHGASVEAIGQAGAYSARDWNYLVAATNRRPFGFDWEEWGTLDAIEVLDQAMASFRIAPDQVYLVGHSMGGHGTWHVGVLFPGRFATIGPSAGWGSFYSYVGAPKPMGPYARSQASSDTLAYIGNLARRGGYVLHGSADDNVPVTEGRTMYAALKKVTSDVIYWEQPGVGHWWDGDEAPGVDCVDWLPLFDFMKAHRLDPTELEFTFTTPSPAVNPTHSYATVLSQADALADSVLTSAPGAAGEVTLTTTNVRALRIDGKSLRARGVQRIRIDGAAAQDVPDGPLLVGPQDGKHPGANGPLNEVFHRPFCFVYPDAGPDVFRHYASFLVSNWAVIGNGLACALPLSAVTDSLRAGHNLIYIGVRPAALDALGWPLSVDAGGVKAGDTQVQKAALVTLFPEADRLSAVFLVTPGFEPLLFRFQPFHSGFAAPDYYVWAAGGSRGAGFFTADWKWRSN